MRGEGREALGGEQDAGTREPTAREKARGKRELGVTGVRGEGAGGR